MKRQLVATAFIVGLASCTSAPDLTVGLDAYDRGDFAVALRQWQPLAKQGVADAQYNLGLLYDLGNGVPEDAAAAADWYRRAAEQGLAKAQHNLGLMYELGEGVAKDDIAAVVWYRRAAEQGLVDAQNNLGAMYAKGQGVAQGYVQALAWYRRAAEQGLADAQYNVGLMYEEGRGVAQDDAAAVSWYRRAAAQGLVDAQYNLGVMYAESRGVAGDHVQAHKWWNLAAAQGDERATKKRDIVAEQMSRELIAEAQHLALAWRPQQRTIASPAAPPSQDRIVVVQRQLATLGYDAGPADGVLGPQTRAAIRVFQAREGIPVVGIISEDLDAALRSALAGDAPAAQTPPRPLELVSTGSGFVVSDLGHILTNEHVIAACGEVRIRSSASVGILASDVGSDLALLKIPPVSDGTAAVFRQGRGIRTGDDVVVVGYPLPRFLASDANVTTGTVSALAGPEDDRRLIQITAPIQPGNSGGPVLDAAGNVVGVVVSKLNALQLARAVGDIPQNVNFSISAGIARSFLDAQDVPYDTAPSAETLQHSDIAARAKTFAVPVECWK